MAVTVRRRAQPESAAIRPDLEAYRSLVRITAAVCVMAHVAYIGLFGWVGAWALAWANVPSAGAHAVAFHLVRHGDRLYAASLLIGLEVLGHAWLASWLIGWDSGFHLLMIPIVPVALMNNEIGAARKKRLALVVTLAYVAMAVLTAGRTPVYPLDPALLRTLQTVNILTMFGVLTHLSLAYFATMRRAHEELDRIASTDPLTGAMNRRRLAETGARLEARRARHGGDLSLLLVDADHFKQVNDRFGHDCGDHVLCHISRSLAHIVRAEDSVCRWGGEEFLVLLPEAGIEEAKAVAERIRGQVEGSPADTPQGPVSITITLGVACAKEGERFEQLVRRADAALYAGKASGRNRVVEAVAGMGTGDTVAG